MFICFYVKNRIREFRKMLYEEMCSVVIMVMFICPSFVFTMTQSYHDVMQIIRWIRHVYNNPTQRWVLKEKQLCNEMKSLDGEHKVKPPHFADLHFFFLFSSVKFIFQAKYQFSWGPKWSSRHLRIHTFLQKHTLWYLISVSTQIHMT